MAENVSLQDMVKRFRILELSNLLSFAGKVKTGPKKLMQERALQLLEAPSKEITEKIVSLYNAYRLENKYSFRNNVGTGNVSGVISEEPTNSNANANDRPPQAVNANVPLPPSQATLHPWSPLVAQHPIPTVNERIQNTVEFRDIPFFEVLEEIVKPTVLRNTQRGDLMYNHSLDFQFDYRQVFVPFESNTRLVQLRFCQLNRTDKLREYFPSEAVVSVNGKSVPLPTPIPPRRRSEKAKRPLVPLNITDYVQRDINIINNITISWGQSNSFYAVRVALVRIIKVEELLIRLGTNKWLQYDHTQEIIRKIMKYDGNGEITATSVTISLKCPITKTRLHYPCRTYNCLHLQCFDARSYLEMNEIKEKWTCPICSQPAEFNNLAIDLYIKNILTSPLSQTTDEVIIDDSLFWTVPTKANGHGLNGTNDIITIMEDKEKTSGTVLTNMMKVDNNNLTVEPYIPVIDLTCSD